ncbi:MAG: hypothetical protein K0R98_1818 [Rickettsiaceae bacterium]|jgi:hypothetical protein|nr:hypothetical protein [Rickettsiaceae bacterium]
MSVEKILNDNPDIVAALESRGITRDRLAALGKRALPSVIYMHTAIEQVIDKKFATCDEVLVHAYRHYTPILLSKKSLNFMDKVNAKFTDIVDVLERSSAGFPEIFDRYEDIGAIINIGVTISDISKLARIDLLSFILNKKDAVCELANMKIASWPDIYGKRFSKEKACLLLDNHAAFGRMIKAGVRFENFLTISNEKLQDVFKKPEGLFGFFKVSDLGGEWVKYTVEKNTLKMAYTKAALSSVLETNLVPDVVGIIEDLIDINGTNLALASKATHTAAETSLAVMASKKGSLAERIIANRSENLFPSKDKSEPFKDRYVKGESKGKGKGKGKGLL